MKSHKTLQQKLETLTLQQLETLVRKLERKYRSQPAADDDFYTATDTQIFTEYHRRTNRQPKNSPTPTASGTPFLIRDASQLNPYQKAKLLALDVETTGLDPHCHQVRLISIASPGLPPAVIDLNCVSDRTPIKQLLSNPNISIIGHNLKFDLAMLAKAGLPVESNRLFDTMLAYQIINNGLQKSAGLGNIAKELLGVELDKSLQSSNWRQEKLSKEQIAYAAKDAAVLLPLFKKLSQLLKQQNLTQTAQIEMKAIKSIIDLELNGCFLSLQELERTAKPKYQKLQQELSDRLEQQLIQIGFLSERSPQQLNLLDSASITTNRQFNSRSQQQVIKLLNFAGIETLDTSKTALCLIAADYPFVQTLLEIRSISSIISTFIDGKLPKSHHFKTGRIHPSWNQLGAGSGRIISSKPTLQNMPRDPDYRKCFVASDRHLIIKADYSQIELRIMAIVAGEEEMIKTYANSGDLHRKTAAYILGKSEAEITKEERQLGKAINFGLIYGMGAKKFQITAASNYKTYLTYDQAKEFRSKFFELYKGIKKYHQLKESELNNNCLESRSLLGRRRLWDENQPPTLNELINNPIQSTNADIIKTALYLIRDKLPFYQAKLLMVVHDEIVIECPERYAQKAADMLVRQMTLAGQHLLNPIPCTVEAQIGPTWG